MESLPSIELDCPPGNPRPWDLIEGVLKNTGFTLNDFAQTPAVFGHVSWILRDSAKTKAYMEIRPFIKERVTALYNQGLIRYGSW